MFLKKNKKTSKEIGNRLNLGEGPLHTAIQSSVNLSGNCKHSWLNLINILHNVTYEKF